MGILAFLGWRGMAGIGVALVLSIFLAIQTSEARHYRKQSDQYQQLYNQEKSAFQTTVANYRTAAAQQKADEDAKNARTVAQQQAATKEQSDEFQARLTAARAEYQRLLANAKAGAHPGSVPGTGVPGISAPVGGPPQTSGQDGLSDAYVCTTQSIQLDELIKWVTAQSKVDPNK